MRTKRAGSTSSTSSGGGLFLPPNSVPAANIPSTLPSPSLLSPNSSNLTSYFMRQTPRSRDSSLASTSRATVEKDEKEKDSIGPPEIPGYEELRAIYPFYFNSVSMYRSRCDAHGINVLVKVSTQGSLEDLTRIRHEWSFVYPEVSNSEDDDELQKKVEWAHLGSFPGIEQVEGILRPSKCLRTGSDGRVVLIYQDRDNLVTLREKYIPTTSKCTEKELRDAKLSSGPPVTLTRSTEEVKEILQIILAMLETIAKIHKHNITHNGLTSSTIFIDGNDRTYLSGWDFSFSLRAEDTSRGYRKTHLKQISDCMGYVSPETTGLTNRLVDFRADFYSIGCILHEILLGFLPFRSNDPSELSHMHVLRTPVAPINVASWMPSSLSEVIMKCLEKNADDRYQGADMLARDLKKVINILDDPSTDKADEFVPSSGLSSPIFLMPQVMYGRDEELNLLHSCYKRNEGTGFQFVFCTGEPGAGKSRLINELEKSSISRNTFFCVSKFDQYQRGAPFYSIVTVLKDIVHQILSGSQHSISQWRSNIISTLRVDLQVLFGSIPELKELLGDEYLAQIPKTQVMGPVPKELRFKFVVKSLFCLFGGQGLTVFLDDIQWCPPTELSLFRELTTFANEKYANRIHITFVCASTPDTVKYDNLVRLVDDLNVRYKELRLSSLSSDAVQKIVNDTLGGGAYAYERKRGFQSGRKRSPTAENRNASTQGQVARKRPSISEQTVDPQVESLAETVYQVTKGNPLFVTLLLKYLHHEQYIFFDHERLGSPEAGGRWRVDFDRFNTSEIPQTVTDVVFTMVNNLPEKTVRILRYAACICSNTFTLEDLAIAADVTYSEAAKALHYALDAQLILPITIHYKFPFLDPVGTTNIELYDDEIRRVAAASTYRFYHDLVQQAVYSLLNEKEALEAHRAIGLRLLGGDHRKPRATKKVLEIANQLKNSVPIVKDEERMVYIELNVRAGNVVYGMLDFDMAHSYFETARTLLTPELQILSPDVTREVIMNLVELEYNRKRYKECLKLVADFFDSCPSDLDKAALLRTKAKALYGLCLTDDAITTGLQSLDLLGIHIEESEDWNRTYHEKLRPRIPVSVTEIRQLVDLKESEDPKYLLVQEVVSIITIPVILSARPNLFKSLTYTAVLAFVDYGSSASCSFSLLSLAMLIQGEGGSANLKRAYEYSKLAIVTLDSNSAVGMDFGINIYEYYALTLAIYFEPLSEVIRYYDIVLSSGQTFEDHCGMLSLSYDLRPLCKFLAGEPLHRVFDYFGQMKPVSVQIGDDSGKLWIQLHIQGMCNMMGNGNSDPSNLEGMYFGDKFTVNRVLESSSSELRYAYFVLKLTLAVIHRHKYVAADIIGNDLPKLIPQVPVTVYHVMLTFYGALAIIDSPEPKNEEMQRLIRQFAQDLENWSSMSPSMFQHKWLLIKAELNKGSYNSIITLDMYEEAIKCALDQGFIHEAAIINERCGDYLQVHSKRRSLAYLREACRLYTLWGAQKKVASLTIKHPELMSTKYEIPRLNMSSTDLSSSAGAAASATAGATSLADLRQRPSFPNNMVVQNSSPLRWILSNLFREETMDEEQLQNGAMDQMQLAGSVDALDSGSSNKEKEQDLELKSALQACLEISESIDMDSIVVKLIESVMRTSGADYCVHVSIGEDGELYVDSVGMMNGVSVLNHEPLFARHDVAPINVVQQVITTGSPVVRSQDPKRFDTVYGRDHYYHNHSAQSVLCMPIQNQIKVIGALYLEHQSLPTAFTIPRIELIGLLCTQAAVSMEKARLYHQMDLAKKTAEEATEEKASFLANMSHEIRTPFNALLSCSIFLLDTDLSEMQREYVETIRSSAGLTLNIIDAILAFSKIEHGSITLDNSPFSLRECVESAVQLVAEPAATKDLELVHLNKCGEIDTIYGDVTRVRQIIINLVGNAVKFTSEGHIVVETTAEKVSSDNRYEFVISVKDTGIGIPKQHRNKIFREFSQVDGSARRVYGGSGLGLAISKKLAELMGGSLTFDSTEGEGTTFWFRVVAVADRPPDNVKNEMYKGKRVLIADQHQTAKESLETELARLGFEVNHCGTVAKAQDYVLAKPSGYYSLVFLDSKLMDGDKCLESRAIKQHSPTTQNIYMTIFGSSIPENMEAKGISAMLMRPVQRSRLMNIIHRVIHSSFNIQHQLKSATTTFDKGMIQTLAVRHPLKILLAEDNPINTRVALQHLKRMGYRADHAKDGVEVLDMCERELAEGRDMYDVVLMDIQMPNKDGIAAAQELKDKYDEDKRPSVIALTANAAGEDRQKCLSMGMVSYIAKPILPQDLAACLMGVKPLKEQKAEENGEAR